MEPEGIQRRRMAVSRRLVTEAGEVLKKIEEGFPDRLEAMGYFYDLFRRHYTEGVPPRDGGKRIGVMCIQVPAELIYAAGAVPVRICSGARSLEQAGADFMPSRSCPLVKATMGMLRLGVDLPQGRLDTVVVPTTCDHKKKTAGILTGMGYDVYTLEVPPVKDTEEARYYWQNSVRRFALALQERTGRRITGKRLKAAIGRMNRARLEHRRLLNLRRSSPPLIYGKDAFLVANACFFDEIERWTGALSALNDELEGRKARGLSAGDRNAPRILLTGSPPVFPNLKLPLLVEETGGVVVADEVCSSSRFLYDAVAYDEEDLHDMVPAVADRYLKPCTCPCLVPNDDRKRRLLEMVKDFAVDGVVYQAYTGCQLYEMEQKAVADELTEAGVPMLYVETDYSPEDRGQLSTRVEAFMESIKARRRRWRI